MDAVPLGDPPRRHRRFGKAVATLVVAVGLLIAVPAGFGEFRTATSPLLVAANLLPWLGPWCLLSAWTRRPLSAAAWVGLLQSLFLGIHAAKFQQLGLPLVPSDAIAASQFLQTPALYLRYVDGAWVTAAVAAGIALLVAQRFERRHPLLEGRRRWLALGAGLCLIGSLALAAPPWRWLYDRDRLGVPIWMPSQAAHDVGVVAHFVHLYLHTSHELPRSDPQARDAARAWYAAQRQRFGVAAGTGTPPDLIVLQSESFMDPGLLQGIDTEAFAPNLARLRANHPHGALRVPAFGGLTTRTEFEVLTGFPLAQSPQIQYPYQGLVHRPMPALPWVLRDAGYHVAGVHPFERRFYRRDRVYPLLGFERFHSIGEFDPGDVHGYHVSDAALNRRIIDLLEGEAPQFIFAVSVENHGPWDEGRGIANELLPVLPTGPDLPEHAALALRQFLHHTQRADAALGELAQWVMQRERPTVLLFYGDHLPGLADVFARWPFDNGEPAQAQTTPWLVVDNRGAIAQRLDLDAADLSGWLLAQAGVVDEELFAPLEAIRRAQARSVLPESARDWHRHWVSARLRESPRTVAISFSKATLATLETWSPQSAEAGSEVAAELPLWFQFAAPIDRGFYLKIGEERLRISGRGDHTLSAELPEHAYRRMLAQPARFPLVLVDPVGRREQQIGEFVVRPRAERLGGWHGLGAGPFCAVEQFGPEFFAPRAPNEHPLRPGVWVKAGCIPPGARFVFDGTVLDTTIVDNLATAWIPPALLDAPREVELRLRADEDELTVGRIVIQP